jgi:hypothetical protein
MEKLEKESNKLEDIFEISPDLKNLDKITEAIQNPPDFVDLSFRVSGKSAHRLNLAKSLLEIVYPSLSEEDLIKYLLRAGVENEIKKLASVWNKINEESDVIS